MTAIVVVLWRVWVARDAAASRAAQAQTQAHEWQVLLRGSDGIAHDVNNLLSAAFVNLEDLWNQLDANPEEAELSVRDITEAIQGATELLTALRQSIEGRPGGSATTSGHMRLQLALLRGRASVFAQLEGDLPHGGESIAAGRVVQNLMHNAVREAKLAGGDVHVRMTSDALEITNKVREPGVLTEAIYDEGVSASGSTGTGLAVAREQASRAGWALSHEVRGDKVTFSCRPLR